MDNLTKLRIIDSLEIQLRTLAMRHGCAHSVVAVQIVDTDVYKPFVQFSLSGQIDLEEFVE